MSDVDVSSLDFHKSYMEKETIRKDKDDILSYLLAQTGILPSMMRKYSSLGSSIVAWITGEKPVLIIGGEPASGKSLLMGELTHRFQELYPSLQSPILISYDRVHYLFLKHLLDVGQASNFLPEGETHPEARKRISAVLRETLIYALLDYRPKNTPIILEAPLIDHRGETVIKDVSWEGMQVLIIHSPAMQSRILQQEKQQSREMSAQPLAIRQIHEVLLQQRRITSLPQQEQDNALIKSWERWLGNREGLVVTWDPSDDEAGFAFLKEVLKAKDILPNPLAPPEIDKFAIDHIEAILRRIPDREAFATEVNNYGHKIVEECLA